MRDHADNFLIFGALAINTIFWLLLIVVNMTQDVEDLPVVMAFAVICLAILSALGTVLSWRRL